MRQTVINGPMISPADLRARLIAGRVSPLHPERVEEHKRAQLAAAPRFCGSRFRAWREYLRHRRLFRGLNYRAVAFSEARWHETILPENASTKDILDACGMDDDDHRTWTMGHLINRVRGILPRGRFVLDKLIQDKKVIDPILSIRDPESGETAALAIFDDHSLIDYALLLPNYVNGIIGG